MRVWRAPGPEEGRQRPSSLAELDGLLPAEPRARQEVIAAVAELAPREGWEARLDLARKWKAPEKDVRLPLSRLVGAVVRALELSVGKDVAQRAEKKIDQLILHDATPQLEVKGGFIVWRSKHGARKHRLVVPDTVPGERIWSHAKVVGRWRGTRASRLHAISLGDCGLTRHLDQFCAVTPIDPSSLGTFGGEDADLTIIPAHLFDDGTPDFREELTAFCRRLSEQGAITVIWFDRIPASLSLPDGVDAFLLSETPETEAWLKNSISGNARLRVAHVGPLSSHQELPFPATVGPYLLQVGADAADDLQLPGFTRVSPDTLRLSNFPDFRIEDPNQGNALHLRSISTYSPGDWSHVRCALHAGFVPVISTTERETLPPAFSSMPHVTRELVATDSATITPRLGQLARRFASKYLVPEVAVKRLSFVLGIPSLVRSAPLVSVLCVSNRPSLISLCIASYRKQNYPQKELILVLNEASLPEATILEILAEAPDVTLLRSPPECSLGESLNRARAVSRGEYWTKMDDDDHYAENYLSDLILTCQRQGANVCGKGTFFTYFANRKSLFLTREAPEDDWSDQYIHGGTILARRRDVEGIDFPPVRQGTDTLFLRQCASAGLRIYSADRYNFAYIRYAEPGHHTFDVSYNRLRKHSVLLGDNLDLSVVEV